MFEENWEEVEPAVEFKLAAHLAYEINPCQAITNALRAARNKYQQTARRCANDHCLKLSQRIQADADQGNKGGMHTGIKQSTVPIKSVPLTTKSDENIIDKKKQMER